MIETILVRRFSRIVVTILLLTVSPSSLLSCANRMDVEIPALNAAGSGVYKSGKFVWFELITHDPDKVGTFYSDLFGWTFSPYAENSQYLTIKNDGNEIGGVVAVSDRSLGSRWISSQSVNDVDETALRVRKLGGRVLYGPADFDDRGKFAQIGDSQGADRIILKTRQGDPRRGD